MYTEIIPIHVCDMQGPFDAAAQLWGYEELFPSAYEDEEAYDYLMRLMMRAFYLLWEEQKKICGGSVCSYPSVRMELGSRKRFKGHIIMSRT